MPLTIFFSTAGNYTVGDDGTRGNNISAVRDASGTLLFPFGHPADTIDFVADVPGVDLTFNTLDTFGTANVRVGSFTDASVTPDSITLKYLRSDSFLTLVSNGAITEGGSDKAADAIAAGVMMSAASGVGSATNAIETQASYIEAETTTGGINIVNTGATQIGGLVADIQGLFVGDSGDINFSTVGFILLADSGGVATVHGADISGDVTLTALGADSDIFSNIDQKAVSVAGGGITLNAGRDVVLGTSGTNFGNDLLATGPISIHAGRDFQLDGTSDVRTGAFGGVVGGNIEIEAGRLINLSNLTGGLQTIQAFAGDLIFTTGPGGSFFENAAFPGAVQTTNNIILNSDNVQIQSGGLNTTGVGSVTIAPVTAGRAIDIGTTVDGGPALGLSDNEFDLLFTLNVNIGDAHSGPVQFSAPITPFIVDNLTVRSGTEILVNSSIALPRALTLRAGDDVYFTAAGSFSSTLDGLTIFVDASQRDDGAGGVADLSNAVLNVAFVTITGNQDPDTLTGSAYDDTLNGGRAADLMRGLAGNDTYIVDNAGDVVDESAPGSAGVDLVRSSISFSLSNASHAKGTVENLTLTGNADINATGNTEANSLIGNSGANILNGRAGADTMRALGGDDIYVVDDAGDVVDESGGASNGIDLVQSSVSFDFTDSVHAKGTLENLTLTGNNDIDGTGGAGTNILIGNSGANILDGRGGADTMSGLGGDDTYVVERAADVVDESVAGSGGIDTVQSSVTFSLADGAHAKGTVENLLLTGTADIDGTGNGANNVMVGNDGVNLLNGAAGSDTLSGGVGNDTFRFDTALDAATNVDAITDFDVDGPGADSFDTIQLENAIFTLLTVTGDLAANKFAAVANNADSDNGSTITYVSSTGKLYYDINGAAVGGATQFAQLATGLALTNVDFFVT